MIENCFQVMKRSVAQLCTQVRKIYRHCGLITFGLELFLFALDKIKISFLCRKGSSSKENMSYRIRCWIKLFPIGNDYFLLFIHLFNLSLMICNITQKIKTFALNFLTLDNSTQVGELERSTLSDPMLYSKSRRSSKLFFPNYPCHRYCICSSCFNYFSLD